MTYDFKVFNQYRRLRQIKRCNNLVTLVPEDVAQHSYYVTLIAYKLVRDYNRLVEEHNLEYHELDSENIWESVSLKECLIGAVFHDLEETFISDIPWSVKHYDEPTHKAISSCLHKKLRQIYDTEALKECSYMLGDVYNMLVAKSGLDGQIVNLADMLEGAWYCSEEIQLGNNNLVTLLAKYIELIHQLPLHSVLAGKIDENYKSEFYVDFMSHLQSVLNAHFDIAEYNDNMHLV